MSLLKCLLEQLQLWNGVFPQQRTLNRAMTLAFGILCGVGKRTITRAICFHGNTDKDWTADYKVFSRSRWEARDLFHPIVEQAIVSQKLDRIVVSIDDTRLWRNGKKIPEAQWHRDPLGPPFQTNLRWGHRFLQGSLVLPLYTQDGQSSSRSLPIRFEMAPVVKKPGKKASEEEIQDYKQKKKQFNLSLLFVAMVKEIRGQLDLRGHDGRPLIITADGSFCNRTTFKEDWQTQRVSLVVRCRKDIVLCKRAPGKGPRFYGKTKFTPQQVREQDRHGSWQTGQIFHGGCDREVRYKQLCNVYWQGGARKRPLRLLIVAPVGYRITKNGRKYYRQPAYLLTSDRTTPAVVLLQDYFDRWGIEVNHRDEKHVLGVGEAQVWNPHSVRKVPALLVAMYSWLQLSAIQCYGPNRTEDYLPLPKWRRGAKRPSCQDLVNLLRKQLSEKPVAFATGTAPPSLQTMVESAAA